MDLDRPDFKLSDDGEPRFRLRFRTPKEFRGDRPVTSDIDCAEPIGDGWVAWYRLVPDENGTPAVVELRIFAQDASESDLAGGLLTDVVRQARPDRIRRLAHEFFQYADQYAAERGGPGFVDLHLERAGFGPGRVKLPAKGRGGGQRKFSDEYLATVAAAYAERVASGSRRVGAEVAEYFDETREWVRDRVHRARKEGILSPSPGQGRSGGVLTSKGLKLLRQQERRDQT